MKERFRLEFEARPGDWYPMYTSPRKGARNVITKTLDECKTERAKAIRRHRPYGRDYAYRIVKITEEIVG